MVLMVMMRMMVKVQMMVILTWRLIAVHFNLRQGLCRRSRTSAVHPGLRLRLRVTTAAAAARSSSTAQQAPGIAEVRVAMVLQQCNADSCRVRRCA